MNRPSAVSSPRDAAPVVPPSFGRSAACSEEPVVISENFRFSSSGRIASNNSTASSKPYRLGFPSNAASSAPERISLKPKSIDPISHASSTHSRSVGEKTGFPALPLRRLSISR
ncbi:MAG: hypothetical protein MPW14_02735 [Candidatus Manganitrophus sp.]|nr:MAG: hypothetical protein MPW14_02735 [Candidatus Manganitrophus sp.]